MRCFEEKKLFWHSWKIDTNERLEKDDWDGKESGSHAIKVIVEETVNI